MRGSMLALPLVFWSGVVLGQEPGAPPPACSCVLLDVSRSVQSSPVKELFKGTFAEFLKTVRHGDTLIVAVISSWSEQELKLPVKEHFPPFAAKTTNLLQKRLLEAQAEQQLKQRLETVASSFNQLLEETHSATDTNSAQRGQQTDIFGALLLTERIFHACPGTTHRLLILSDMVHEAEGINFDKDRLSPSYFAKILATLHREHRMPKLTGVEVYVVGAHHREPERFRKIRDFWYEYFGKTGAKLVDYGAAPLGFDR